MRTLRKAFAGESQANRKYAVFAEKAAAEGYPVVGNSSGRQARQKPSTQAPPLHPKCRRSTEENLKGATRGRDL